MNRNGKTNVMKGPDIDYNAYSGFFDSETEAHFIAKWMEFAGINDFEGLISSQRKMFNRPFVAKGHVTCFGFKYYIFCCNGKNTTNGKSMMKLARRPSLSPLDFKE